MAACITPYAMKQSTHAAMHRYIVHRRKSRRPVSSAAEETKATTRTTRATTTSAAPALRCARHQPPTTSLAAMSLQLSPRRAKSHSSTLLNRNSRRMIVLPVTYVRSLATSTSKAASARTKATTTPSMLKVTEARSLFVLGYRSWNCPSSWIVSTGPFLSSSACRRSFSTIRCDTNSNPAAARQQSSRNKRTHVISTFSHASEKTVMPIAIIAPSSPYGHSIRSVALIASPHVHPERTMTSAVGTIAANGNGSRREDSKRPRTIPAAAARFSSTVHAAMDSTLLTHVSRM
mmetsp:Transcript_14975/g.46407  ORF Transcript_14975/g.46407 Transcript_14975/m.46407 type:complete len:290 (+) Transcript_14975:637-1506(+)